MKRFGFAALLAGLLMIPVATMAMESTFWDFRGTIPGKWPVQKLTVTEQTPQGLHIRTDTEGVMYRTEDLPSGVDDFVMTVATPADIEAFFIWQPKGGGQDDIWQMPFTIPQSLTPTKLGVDPSYFDEWNPQSTIMGFRFPAGSELLLQDITLENLNVFEKLIEQMKSFWTFDDMRPYSINFLWGPLLGSNPVARDQLFHYLPPRAASALRLFYVAAAIIAVAAFALKRYRWKIGTIGLIALWLLLDVRMGAEIISYATHDWKTYVLAEESNKELRGHGAFYKIADHLVPELRKAKSYALLVQPETPYYSNLRYMTYPSIPLLGEAGSGSMLWAIVGRADMAVDEQGRLFQHTGLITMDDDGKIVNSTHRIVTPPGKIMLQEGKDTFLFQVTPK